MNVCLLIINPLASTCSEHNQLGNERSIRFRFDCKHLNTKTKFYIRNEKTAVGVAKTKRIFVSLIVLEFWKANELLCAECF